MHAIMSGNKFKVLVCSIYADHTAVTKNESVSDK